MSLTRTAGIMRMRVQASRGPPAPYPRGWTSVVGWFTGGDEFRGFSGLI